VPPHRELDDALASTDTNFRGADQCAQRQEPSQPGAGLLCQSVFRCLAGYEDVNDADRLCRDPAMRWVVGDRAITASAASASQMGRFATKWLPARNFKNMRLWTRTRLVPVHKGVFFSGVERAERQSAMGDGRISRIGGDNLDGNRQTSS
jgi:Transposase DDE domain group 1